MITNKPGYLLIIIFSFTLLSFTIQIDKLYAQEKIKDELKSDDQYDSYEYTSKSGKTYKAKLPKDRDPQDYTPIGFVKQPSFVKGGGMINKNEHAFLFYIDGDLFPMPLMLGYRYGMVYWWDIGFDIGGDYGIFQTFIHTKIENIKTRKSEFFFWSNTIKTGYKQHKVEFSSTSKFDDISWVTIIENSFGFRLGKKRRQVLYLNTKFYIDSDLHKSKRQTDYYIIPAALGFETMVGEYTNFFIEAGAAYSINGMEFSDGSKLYENQWFPVFQIGMALRTGKKTAIYYTRETKGLSRGKQPKLNW